MIVETCPRCEHNLVSFVLTCYPPVPKKYCPYCGWSWTGEPEEITRVPFMSKDDMYEFGIEESYFDPILSDQTTFNVTRYCEPAFANSPCWTCQNNPKNGGSGNCNCTLGQLEIRG